MIVLKFKSYRSISCFTGSKDRRTKKEGILGIILDENESIFNVELFLSRNLSYAIDNPSDNIMESIYKDKLLHYIELANIFNEIEIEKIPEIFIIQGNNEDFTSYLLKIALNMHSIDISEIYKKILKKQDIKPYYYELLSYDNEKFVYLIVKILKFNEITNKILESIKNYLRKDYNFSLELLTLLLLPSEIGIIPLKTSYVKKYPKKEQSVLETLQKSTDYVSEFNSLIESMKNGDIYFYPIL